MDTDVPPQGASGDSYCDTPGTNWFSDILRSGYCGVAHVLEVPFGALGEMGRAQAGAMGEAAAVAGQAIDAGRDVAKTVADDQAGVAKEVLNPWNLFGLGAGLGSAGLVTVSAGAVGLGLVADWTLNDGRATLAVGRAVGLARGGRRK